MAEQIVLVITPDGKTSVEGVGFEGPACDTVLRALAEALGTVEDVRKKPEYHRAVAHQRVVKAGG